MRKHTIKVYQFNELEDKAKERARDWWRENGLDYEWWDFVVEDFVRLCATIGIEVDHIKRKTGSGKDVKDYKVFFSGFSSQGDGACFEGSYQWNMDIVKNLMEYAPKDDDLHAIARELASIPNVVATIKHRGHYNHSGCTEITMYTNRAPEMGDGDEKAVKTTLRDLMDWLYARLEKEYNWLLSDAQVDETIIANEYEFTKEGHRFHYA